MVRRLGSEDGGGNGGTIGRSQNGFCLRASALGRFWIVRIVNSGGSHMVDVLPQKVLR